VEELKVALLGVPELLGGMSGSEAFTLSFDEHGQSLRLISIMLLDLI
jgi:hypothetical protein